MRTAGRPHHLVLTSDRRELAANGKDLAFVTVQAVDKDGNPCPLADNALRFDVVGAGEYRAACNGDATSTELFHLPTMKLFNLGSWSLSCVRMNNPANKPYRFGKGLKTAK